MGHYDDIRDEYEARQARDARANAMLDATRRLQRALGISETGNPKLADLLRLKAEASAKAAELQSAVRMGDTVFEVLLTFGEAHVVGPNG